MARIRSLKPEFWTDSRVVGIQNPWGRLLFMGMWNFALCDAGHLEDDALALKLRILPAENLDAEEVLGDVLASGMVTREVLTDGTSFLVIRSFPRHAKADARWTPRCPVCAREKSQNLTETHASFGGDGRENLSSSGQSQGEGLVEGLVKSFSSDSADAEPDGDEPDEEEDPDEPAPTAEERPDVERLCRLLVELMIANGSRKPYVTKRWRQQARILIDRDKIPIAEAENVMQWALSDEFWGPNIASMPKFRAKFDQLRGKRDEARAKLRRQQERAANTRSAGQPGRPEGW